MYRQIIFLALLLSLVPLLLQKTEVSAEEGLWALNAPANDRGGISPNTTGSFTLSISPTSRTVKAGEIAEYTLNTTSIGGFSGTITITFSNLPPNSTVPPFSGTVGVPQPFQVVTSRLTPPGTYNFTVTGVSGSVSASAGAQITVLPVPDFSLSLSPSQVELRPGDRADFTLSASFSGGFTGPVELFVSGLPAGATASAIGSQFPLTIRISTISTTPTGVHPFAIIGRATIEGQTVERSATATLIITALPCSYSISPTSQDFTATGGSSTVTVTVTSGSNCNWQASTSDSWIRLNNNGGSGSGSLSYTVSANTSTSSRTGTILVAGLTHTVTQSGTDSVPPTVSVIAPNGGESFIVGDTIEIQWVASDNQAIARSRVELLVAEQQQPTTIADSLAGDVRRASYTIPSTLTTSAGRIRVTVFDGAGNQAVDSSDGAFTISQRDDVPPTVSLSAPRGGESFVAGSQTVISFSGSDVGTGIAVFVVSYSTDGGATFPRDIARLGEGSSGVIWNIPDTLQGNNIRVRVSATDRGGNTSSATSGNLTVTLPQEPTPVPKLQVVISFSPPPAGLIAPPQNVTVSAGEFKPQAEPFALLTTIAPQQTASTQLTGYNIYRVPQPPEGQPLPPAEQIVNQANLIASLPPNITSYTDQVSTGKGDNFAYSVTSTFGSGQQSSGSQPTGTNLPVIKNPRFVKNALFMDLAGSFIKPGAFLVVNGLEIYKLEVDPSGILYTVSKKQLSTPSGLKIRKVIKIGATSNLMVRNPDTKTSVITPFVRQ